MKNIRFILFLFLISFGFLLGVKAQSVELRAIVTMTDGQEQQYFLTEDDQISFEGQETLVITTQGTTVQINIDDIRKIEFVDVMEAQEINASSPFFYPNPVSKAITFGNIEHNQLIRICSVEGRLVREFQANPNERIDLSSLAPGVYVMRINDLNFKLLKQ